MSIRPSNLRRRVLSLAVLAATALPCGRGSATTAGPIVAQPTAVGQRHYPEVRLRKMHMVRPDLIPFPIDFDVYC